MKRFARLLFELLALVGVVLALMPSPALASDPRPYPSEIRINGTSLAESVPSGVSYDPNTGELTLNNYTGGGIAVTPGSDYRELNLTIVLKGNNTINCTGVGQSDCGIFVAGGDSPKVRITSSEAGCLFVNATYTGASQKNVTGIWCTGNVTIDGSAFVNVEINGGSSNSRLCGINCTTGYLNIANNAQLVVEMNATKAVTCYGATLGLQQQFYVSSNLNQLFDMRGVSGCFTYGIQNQGTTSNPFVFSNAPVISFYCDAPRSTGYAAEFPEVVNYDFFKSTVNYQAHTYTLQAGATKYSINVIGGMAKDDGASTITQAAPGDIVNLIEDPAPAGERFDHWNITPSSVHVDQYGSFYMPASNVTAIAVYVPDVPAGGVAMYRLYNPNSGEHFYTAVESERKHLVDVGWNYEGMGWIAPASSSTPVYRLYNPYAGEHHYTTSASEKDGLVKAGWNYEGVGWYSDDARTTPLYRQYNPNQYACNHNYTTSAAERDWLVGLGWHDEGIGWYGM